MIHHEDQSSYFNGLSGYEEFATKGGGPISDIQGYPQQNASHIAGFHPVSMTHDGNNAGHKFAHQNAGNVNLGNVGYLPFDQYDNDEDNFIQLDAVEAYTKFSEVLSKQEMENDFMPCVLLALDIEHADTNIELL